ncbi:hypothetical protein L6452_00162 [Arctium lappa]|uniref:Uncharacterized protein n=1 Tax=Arctium lappa TaxID=4217 RepID=A0ACB9FDZ1_ARCLA|nr:hypothetical protein L6452_00162 [Arctium lappa]
MHNQRRGSRCRSRGEGDDADPEDRDDAEPEKGSSVTFLENQWRLAESIKEKNRLKRRIKDGNQMARVGVAKP